MTELVQQLKKQARGRPVALIERRVSHMEAALKGIGMAITRSRCDTLPVLTGHIGKLKVQAHIWCMFHDVSRVTVYAFDGLKLQGVVAILLVNEDGTWTTEVNKVLDVLLDREVPWEDT